MLHVQDGLPPWVEPLYEFGVKLAEVTDPEIVYNLVGTLYLSSSGWLLLTVPNAMVRGVFSAMKEPGVELPPPGPDGHFNAHITVMTPDDLAQIGGADKVTERGKQFTYTFGRIYSVVPDGWADVARVWFLKVHSPELQQLRRSYGLSSLPKDGKHDLHITLCVRKKGVLARTPTHKNT